MLKKVKWFHCNQNWIIFTLRKLNEEGEKSVSFVDQKIDDKLAIQFTH